MVPSSSLWSVTSGRRAAASCNASTGRLLRVSTIGSRADRDTAGRPNCRTDGGRVVYGGGGIYPDLVVDDPEFRSGWRDSVRTTLC
jgi:hypothetical protein